MRIGTWGIVAAVGWIAGAGLVACHESPVTDEARSAKILRSNVKQSDGGQSAEASAAGGAASVAILDGGSVTAGAPMALPVSASRAAATSIPPASLKAAVTANNAFATALFAQLRQNGPDKNLLSAPISATLALSMAYAGATERTRSEMAAALRFGAQPAASLLEGQNALSQALLTRGAEALAIASKSFRDSKDPPLASDYSLQIVNSVWGEASYSWEAPFLNTLAADFGSSVYARDFRHQWEPARLEVNAWVSAQTSDKIKDLLPPDAVTQDTRLVLVNALHLKFPWDVSFEPGQTAAGKFTRADRKQVSASFMNREGQLSYVDDGAAQIVALPLIGRQLSVIIALPHPGVSLTRYARSLRGGSPALMQPAKTALVALALPKVTFTSATFSLSSALKKLGMVQAFDPDAAHFEGMCAHPPPGERLYVGDVLQKTMIALQESGVEAAAASAVLMMSGMGLRLGPAPVPIPMIVNRPYLIAVVDAPTGAVLLLGQIQDPSE